MRKIPGQKLHGALAALLPVLYKRDLSFEFVVYALFRKHPFSLLAQHRRIKLVNSGIHCKHCRSLSYNLVCKAASTGQPPFLCRYVIHGSYSPSVVLHKHSPVPYKHQGSSLAVKHIDSLLQIIFHFFPLNQHHYHRYGENRDEC